MRGPLVVKGEADALHENYKIEIKYKSYSKQFFFSFIFSLFSEFRLLVPGSESLALDTSSTNKRTRKSENSMKFNH